MEPDAEVRFPDPLLLFDGECGLCQRSVKALIKYDRSGLMRFAPLGGETSTKALAALGQSDLANADSVVLITKGKAFIRSDAGIRALLACGGVWKLFGVFLIVPKPLRDWLYLWVAKRRKRFFAKRACPIPTAEERARVLP